MIAKTSLPNIIYNKIYFKILFMHQKKIIALIGLMGAGKTSIGSKLANQLKYYFIDSDHEIEDFEHRTIADIFAQNGEKYFREIEAKTIENILNRDEFIVLSLGGGAFLNKTTQELLKDKAITIWLYASIQETLRRVSLKSNRPLLEKKNKREILEELARVRYPIYQKSDFKFDTTDLTFEQIVKKILNKINVKNYENN